MWDKVVWIWVEMAIYHYYFGIVIEMSDLYFILGSVSLILGVIGMIEIRGGGRGDNEKKHIKKGKKKREWRPNRGVSNRPEPLF